MSAFFAGEKWLEALASREARWYAFYTRARHEKKVERLLGESGVEGYLPVIQRLQQWKDRKKLVAFTLFPSYIFARLALDRLQMVLAIPGIVTVVRVNGVPAPIRDEELQNMRLFSRALAASELAPEMVPLPDTGGRVQVQSGPFAGVEGTVVERRGRRRIVVGLDVLGRGVEVDLPVESLRPLS
jgi:transcription antitermination factor NusG